MRKIQSEKFSFEIDFRKFEREKRKKWGYEYYFGLF